MHHHLPRAAVKRSLCSLSAYLPALAGGASSSVAENQAPAPVLDAAVERRWWRFWARSSARSDANSAAGPSRQLGTPAPGLFAPDASLSAINESGAFEDLRAGLEVGLTRAFRSCRLRLRRALALPPSLLVPDDASPGLRAFRTRRSSVSLVRRAKGWATECSGSRGTRQSHAVRVDTAHTLGSASADRRPSRRPTRSGRSGGAARAAATRGTSRARAAASRSGAGACAAPASGASRSSG